MAPQGYDSRVSRFGLIFLYRDRSLDNPRNVDDMPWIAWISVLKLSLMWKMKIIHDLAIQKIETRINNTDEWITIFKISTRLRIEKLRDLAIRTLRPRELDPLKRIELATEYGLELPWLLDEFVTRKKAISVEEEEQLGWNITAKLFRERHRQLEQEIEDEYYDIKSDIRTVVGRDNIGAKFDNSLISFLRPELLTATDSSIIQRDETYYLVDVILSVSIFVILKKSTSRLTQLVSGGRHFIQAASLYVRGELRYIPGYVSISSSRRLV